MKAEPDSRVRLQRGLRDKILPAAPASGHAGAVLAIREQLQHLTRQVLDPKRPGHSLRVEVLALNRLLAEAAALQLPREETARGETRTAQGLALSPAMAAMCAEDFVRTVIFLRGVHEAVAQLGQQNRARPVRILYAGCGPQATLALPLMTVFPPQEAVFTLLDVHPDSIESVGSAVALLSLAESVTRLEVADACEYRIRPDEVPDVLLFEMMQAGLEAEPQVAVTRHLLKQAPGAVLLPAEVRIELVLMNPAREFEPDLREVNRPAFERDRISLGTVFALNQASVGTWEGDVSGRLPARRVRLPERLEPCYQPMLLTSVQVFGEHLLKDYDSGLTCPRRPRIEGQIRAGEEIHFCYELGQRPGLMGRILPRRAAADSPYGQVRAR